MRRLNKIESIVFLLGGLLMVISAGCYVFLLWQKVMCWVFLVGALAFVAMQLRQRYEGNDIVIKRLRRIQACADLCFLLAGLLMIDSANRLFLPLFQNSSGTGYIEYYQFIYNKWVVLLLIAAILELYTTHRIASEINKTKNT